MEAQLGWRAGPMLLADIGGGSLEFGGRPGLPAGCRHIPAAGRLDIDSLWICPWALPEGILLRRL